MNKKSNIWDYMIYFLGTVLLIVILISIYSVIVEGKLNKKQCTDIGYESGSREGMMKECYIFNSNNELIDTKYFKWVTFYG